MVERLYLMTPVRRPACEEHDRLFGLRQPERLTPLMLDVQLPAQPELEAGQQRCPVRQLARQPVLLGFLQPLSMLKAVQFLVL